MLAAEIGNTKGDEMKKLVLIVFVCIFSCGSNNFIKYGYLPGGDYQYYQPLHKYDLNRKEIIYVTNDKRDNIRKIECSGTELDRNTELEGKTGYDYFTNYLKAMTEYNNGVVNPNSMDTIYVDLQAISSQIFGFGYLRVFGDTKFTVNYKGNVKSYCAEVGDGDKDSPLGKMDFDTRKGAMRKLASASTRKALEEFMEDIQNQK